MIEQMEYLPFIAAIVGGAVASLRLLIGEKLNEIIITIKCWRRCNKKDFYLFYDNIRSGACDYLMKIINSPKVETIDQFSKLHKDARDEIYSIFNHYRVNAIKDAIFRVLPIILMPSIIFLQYWYYYLIGVVAAIVLLIIYKALMRYECFVNNDLLVLAQSFRRYLKIKFK